MDKKTIWHEYQVLISIAVFALLFRIILIIGLKTYDIPAKNDHFSFGFETGRVARAIASGDGFSSPFEIGDLPTAWVAPAYTYILALVFKIFGIYSQGSAFVILFLNSLFSSITCIVVYYIGKITIHSRVGFLSAIFLAIYPPSIWHSINTIWNTTLSAFLMSALILYAVASINKLNLWKSVVGGILMGFTTLVNPGSMIFYPFYFYWIYSKIGSNHRKASIYIILTTLFFLFTIAPWVIRNYNAFGKFIPVKSNLGLELRLGNNPNADGTFVMKKGTKLHPTFSDEEMARFKAMKEIAYAKYSLEEAKKFIYGNPLKFVSLSVKRFYLFWCGDLSKGNSWKGNIRNIDNLDEFKKIFFILPIPFFIFGIVMAVRKKVDISLFMYLVFSYPLMYYITHVANRYRYPIEPFILIIGSYGVYVIYDKLRGFINKPGRKNIVDTLLHFKEKYLKSLR